MTLLYAIIRYYFSYYFYFYFSYYEHMGLLFFLLWHIIFHYFFYYFQLCQGVSTQKIGICSQQFPTHTPRIDWSVSMMNVCTTASTGRCSQRRDSSLMKCSRTIIHIIFTIMPIISPGWPALQSLLVLPTHCRSMNIDSVCYYELSEHQGSCHCCWNAQTVPLLWYYFSLYHYYCNYTIICIIPKQKSLLGLEFIADNLPLASFITGEHCS